MAGNKRDIIISTAQKLFQQSGLWSITMEDVAKAAGMGKSSMYYYFKSKEEIFTAVLDAEMNGIILETIRQVGSKETLLQQLEAFAMVKYEMVRKRKALYKATETSLDDEMLSKYTDIKLQVHKVYLQKEKNVLLQVLIGAMHRHEIRKMNNEELDHAIFIFLASIRGLNREFILHGTDLNPVTIFHTFCHNFCTGLH
ncbi:TetR/AcrR family transcriptional regulator [Chitinophaga sp. Cy-1792]|uniref:TetR/AcrR family transcriptional regulator n=1 Tax=Chitinophaga sp. Cy-1792 TaxID=2608339 RepID=UPI001421CF4D|nr:TetR/AcrR family transcriptional regulator [Chitinophaga sp. Cy-1792]NIG55607.1 TetR/AcrR family transcriptional regulator [Chitinophaga sp. Cy-1792]